MALVKQLSVIILAKFVAMVSQLSLIPFLQIEDLLSLVFIIFVFNLIRQILNHENILNRIPNILNMSVLHKLLHNQVPHNRA